MLWHRNNSQITQMTSHWPNPKYNNGEDSCAVRVTRHVSINGLISQLCFVWNGMEIRRAMLLVLITLLILQVTHNSLYDLCAGCWLCLKERMIILLHHDIQQRDTHNHPYSSTKVCNKEHDKLILEVHLTRLERQDNYQVMQALCVYN